MSQKQKTFFLTQIQDILTDWDGANGCLATDSIMVHGQKVAYMYREEPHNEYDSGWCFFAADDDDEYVNNPDNLGVYALNTLCNYDPDIMPLLTAPYGSAFGRDENGQFVTEAFSDFADKA